MTYIKFSEKGYSATLRKIAKASGLKKQSLYNCFDSKAVSFIEMIERKVKNHFNQQIVDLIAYQSLETIEQLE